MDEAESRQLLLSPKTVQWNVTRSASSGVKGCGKRGGSLLSPRQLTVPGA